MPIAKGSKLSDQAKANQSAAQRKRWAEMSPEKKEEVRAALRRRSPRGPCPESRKQMLRQKYSGPNAFAWKGGKHFRKDGYISVYAPDCGFANKRGYVLEHRLVMSKILGRPLDEWDIVHHKNVNRGDNRPENLEHLRGDNRNARYPKICPGCGYAW